jgi:TolB-like protein
VFTLVLGSIIVVASNRLILGAAYLTHPRFSVIPLSVDLLAIPALVWVWRGKRFAPGRAAAVAATGGLVCTPRYSGTHRMECPASAVPLAPGTRLGRYEIVTRLGAGGMGEVYRARDTRLGRDVAIKVLPDAFATDRDRVRRFEQEARAVAALNHPNICQIHDVGPGYLVLEYVDGTSLRGPLPPEKTVRLALQIASALETAHRRGILHRDLKPGNMLVTADDRVKLLDFGLARLIDRDSGAVDVTCTTNCVVLGTPAYMSPEQVQGRSVDARADVFSFGAVIHELLAGERAFQGNTAAEVLGAVLHGGPLPSDASALARIVSRCLEKDPSRRYQGMAEVRAALEDHSRAQPDYERSIAVLPFANLSDDRDTDYFSAGLTEEIINALVHVPGLKVTARTSGFAFKGQNADVRHIGEALQVVHVLEGSVRRAAQRIRVTAQLVKAADGYHLWSARYDREVSDVFAAQDEIAAAIATALNI